MDERRANEEVPPFWKGEAAAPQRERRGDGFGTLAEYAPPLLRPLARGVATALSVGGVVGPLSVAILVILGAVFIAGEIAELRRDWYAGEASRAQVALFEVQRVREFADTEVAKATLWRTVEEEAETIARREQAISDGVKPLQEGWGDARLTSAFASMKRYRKLFDDARREGQRCRERGCQAHELQRWSAREAVYYRLFYAVAGFLRKEGFAPEGDGVKDYGLQRLAIPAAASEFDLGSDEGASTSREPLAQGSPR